MHLGLFHKVNWPRTLKTETLQLRPFSSPYCKNYKAAQNICSENNGIGLTNSYSDIEELDIRSKSFFISQKSHGGILVRWNNSLQDIAINDPETPAGQTLLDLWADGICSSGGKNCNVTDDTLQSGFNVIKDYAKKSRCVFISSTEPGKYSAE